MPVEQYSFINEVLVALKEAAEILGLKYHHARKLLLNDNSIGFYDFNGKRMWRKSDILNYKSNHFNKPIMEV